MLRLFAYSKEEGIRTFDSAAPLPELVRNEREHLWLDLESPSTEEIELLSSAFHFHPLAIEDCLSESSLPKIDDYGDHLFLILHGSTKDRIPGQFTTYEIDCFISRSYLVTVHFHPSRSIERSRDRCLKGSPAIAKGLDFLLHEILDGMVDNYFPLLDDYDDLLDGLEDAVFTNPTNETLNKIFSLKRDVMHLRRVAAPQREIFNRLSRNDFPALSKKSAMYFRDVYDHLVRIYDLAESYRDLISGILEAYLSVVSNRMNEIMKVLTVIATIILPLTLITGIYGMNFEVMPELHLRYGYFMVLGTMAGLSAIMLIWFRRKGWF